MPSLHYLDGHHVEMSAGSYLQQPEVIRLLVETLDNSESVTLCLRPA